MTTGYIYDVEEGKITEFRVFALRCARAVGFLASLREEPMDAKLPAEIKPDSYYHEQVMRLTQEEERHRVMTPEQCIFTEAHEREEIAERKRQYLTDITDKNLRLRAMLQDVEEWAPPSKDHESLKRFMAEQLSEQIREPYPIEIREPMDPEQWRRNRLASIRADLASARERRTDAERDASRATAWLNALRESLP